MSQNLHHNVPRRQYYPPGWRHLDVHGQVMAAQSLFPGLNLDPVRSLMNKVQPALAPGMEAHILFPKLRVIAELAEKYGANPNWPMFSKALWLIDGRMRNLFGEENYFFACKGILPEFVRLSARTEKAFEELDKAMPGDFLLLPMQFGKKWANRPTQEAVDLLAPNEFALDPVTVGMILMIHRQVLPLLGSVLMETPGGLFSYKQDGKFLDSAHVRLHDWLITLFEWNFLFERGRPNQGVVTALAPFEIYRNT